MEIEVVETIMPTLQHLIQHLQMVEIEIFVEHVVVVAAVDGDDDVVEYAEVAWAY